MATKPHRICTPSEIRRLAIDLLKFADTVEKHKGDPEDVSITVIHSDQYWSLTTDFYEDDKNFFFYLNVVSPEEERVPIDFEEE